MASIFGKTPIRGSNSQPCAIWYFIPDRQSTRVLAERAKIYFLHKKEGEEILENISYDQTGKINLNGIYNRDEPVSYFSALSRLGYRIPQEAKPRFESLIEARRRSTQSEAIKVIDLGCSYGIN